MAIATLAEYQTGLTAQREILPITIPVAIFTVGRTFDLFNQMGIAATTPTLPVVPTNLTAGALGQQNATGGLQTSILGGYFQGVGGGNCIVCDRLSHQSGLSGIVTGAQTTNLPTAALTRYTSGEGVMLGISIYSLIGTTGTTLTATYTNQAGIGSRVTPTVAFGATGFREVNRLLMLPLQSGDTGVRSVESVTIAGTTGAAGNFGVTLFKPLYVLCNDQANKVISSAGFISGQSAGGIPKIELDACLFVTLILEGTGAQSNGFLIVKEN